MKRYKVMAYVLSTGLWDTSGQVRAEDVLGIKDEEFERDLRQWQTLYDGQFKRRPYEFDWELFNELGRSLTERIREKLPPQTEVYYEPSDDREFFSPDECSDSSGSGVEGVNEVTLRERMRSLVHLGTLMGSKA
ncbi:hypothetical protein [Pontiella desulfatans]|uniref:hypothetical protein n=1 Tax=Pontiella desulfatans TaxID=2750659 RepID=UPI001444685A|nr:hypothetical protein [Pontiella desulfatans]